MTLVNGTITFSEQEYDEILNTPIELLPMCDEEYDRLLKTPCMPYSEVLNMIATAITD